jgi:hypothetical protein|tara:strand:- start:1963 stop:3240 length:1278 start_codon:yes stop_codon:yes gene_type:complete
MAQGISQLENRDWNFKGSLSVNGTKVVSSSGSIVANIQDTLATGSIYVGDNSNVTSELDAKTSGQILVGSGTTLASVAVSGDATLSSAGVLSVTKAQDGFEVTSTSTGASGANLLLQHDSSSPAISDGVGILQFGGKNDGASDLVYASVVGQTLAVTAGTEEAVVKIKTQDSTGSLESACSFLHDGSNGIVRAGDGAAAGIFSSEGDFDLMLQTGNATTGSITIKNGANKDISVSPDGSGSFVVNAEIRSQSNVGAPGTNVSDTHYGDGYHHVTVLTLTNADLGSTPGAGNLALGALIYTFPAGAHLHSVTYGSISLQGDAPVQADTPDVGIGSVVGSGAQNLLSGVGATSEDYVTGYTGTDCNGTADTIDIIGAVAGIHTGISLNKDADVKDVYLNAAANWSGATATLTATGTVTLKWTYLGNL